MTHADINDLETRDYVFKIGDRGKGIQARYDENTDALIFPRAAFDYVYKLLKEALSQEPCKDAISREAVCKMICAEFVNPQDGMQEWRNATNDVVENILHKAEQLPSVTPKSIECDAISRDAVKELIKCGVSTDTYDDVEQVCKWIDALPSVTQKSGKWIKGKDEYGTNHFTCPFCGHDIATKAENWDDNYCANCGAKMESEDKTE